MLAASFRLCHRASSVRINFADFRVRSIVPSNCFCTKPRNDEEFKPIYKWERSCFYFLMFNVFVFSFTARLWYCVYNFIAYLNTIFIYSFKILCFWLHCVSGKFSICLTKSLVKLYLDMVHDSILFFHFF